MAKVKYVGESFGAVSLTDGVIYECWVDPEDEGLLRVIDDTLIHSKLLPACSEFSLSEAAEAPFSGRSASETGGNPAP